MEEKVYEEALEEYNNLEHRTGILRENIARCPPGYLKINHKNGKEQYYHLQGDPSKPEAGKEIIKYIRKHDSQLAFLLAQKSHDIKLLKELEKRKAALAQLIEAYSETDPYAIWESYSDARKKLVSTAYLSDERYAKEWQARQYQPKGFSTNAPEYYSNAVRRLEQMAENGILPGKNLIMTAETGTRVLSVKVMNVIIREYLS